MQNMQNEQRGGAVGPGSGAGGFEKRPAAPPL